MCTCLAGPPCPDDENQAFCSFQATSAAAAQIAEAAVPPPRSLNPRVPPALNAVCMRALARERAEILGEEQHLKAFQKSQAVQLN